VPPAVYYNRLGLEHVEGAVADVEAHHAGDSVRHILVEQWVSDVDPLVYLVCRLSAGLCDDGLVALAVDGVLPPAGAEVLAGLGVAPEGEAPLVEKLYGGGHVPRYVVDQVLPHHAE
jgi:hypothetical protein